MTLRITLPTQAWLMPTPRWANQWRYLARQESLVLGQAKRWQARMLDAGIKSDVVACTSAATEGQSLDICLGAAGAGSISSKVLAAPAAQNV
eukprot:5392404-Amphidinium_carterae.1